MVSVESSRPRLTSRSNFLDAIANHPALDTTIHRTSWSGISVSLVRDPGEEEAFSRSEN